MSVIYEWETENAKGQRLNLTVRRREVEIEAVIGNESRSGRTVRWLNLDRQGLLELGRACRAARDAVFLAEALAGQGADDA